MSNLGAWAVLVQSDGLHNASTPVVHGDIALSINTKNKYKCHVLIMAGQKGSKQWRHFLMLEYRKQSNYYCNSLFRSPM